MNISWSMQKETKPYFNLNRSKRSFYNYNNIGQLIAKNKVEFSSDNIAAYWDMLAEYSDDFKESPDINLIKIIMNVH